ncbi:MAG: PFL_4703 family integrating conjugative element protein [Gammaproteobacteria bacterium]
MRSMSMRFTLWKKMDADNQLIKALWCVIGIMVCVNTLLMIGWQSAPHRLTVYIPPDITQGATVKPGNIPASDVYAFAFQIFTAINTWSLVGEKDYPEAIHDYRYYLTTHFYNALQADYHERSQDGSLSRTRMMSGFSGMGYQDVSVKILGKNTWEVDLTMHVVEEVGNSVVKDVLITYPMRVVRVDTSIALNPWGLALDGFVSDPVRVKTFV